MVLLHQTQMSLAIGTLPLLRFQIVRAADRLVLLLALAVSIVSKICIHLG